jgi:hypothetical protein
VTSPATNAEVGPATATCPAGKVLLGGGATISHSANNRGAIENSNASTAGVGGTWSVTALVTSGGNGNFSITAYAICTT